MFIYNDNQIETDAQGYLLDHTQWEKGMMQSSPKEKGLS